MIVPIQRNGIVWLEDNGVSQAQADNENLSAQIKAKEVYLVEEYEKAYALLFSSYRAKSQLNQFYIRHFESKNYVAAQTYTDNYAYKRAARIVDPDANPGLFAAQLASTKAERVSRASQIADYLLKETALLDEELEWQLDQLELVDPDGYLETEQAKLDAIMWP